MRKREPPAALFCALLRAGGQKMNVCGLDVGTSGVKAVVFDEKGAGIANAYRDYETQIDPDGKRGLDLALIHISTCLAKAGCLITRWKSW